MKAIRHHLDVYDTVLRLAYDMPTWKALLADCPGDPPSNHPLDPTSNLGCVYGATWEQSPDVNWARTARPAKRGILHVSIWINVEDCGADLAELVATVAHEGVHAAADIFGHIASRHTPEQASEPFAYLVDWLVRWVWDNLP